MSTPKDLEKLRKTAVRWKTRQLENKITVDQMQTDTVQPSANKKKRKNIPEHETDDFTESAVVHIANRTMTGMDETRNPNIQREPQAKRHMKMLDLKTLNNMNSRETIQITTSMRPMTEFEAEKRLTSAKPLDEGDNDPSIPGKFLTDKITSVESIFDKNQSFLARRTSAKRREGVQTYPRDKISAAHFAKIFFAPHGYFSPCIRSESAECVMQTILPHPNNKTVPMMAYVTPDEYRAVEGGFVESPYKPELCEFCNRYLTNLEAKRSILGTQRSEIEIPSRYHITGIPGEYSKHSIIQPNGSNRTDGVLGDFRVWNSSDYEPVMGAVQAGKPLIETVISMQEYQRVDKEKAVLEGIVYVEGWAERKGLFYLNEMALLTNRQIDPYESRVVDTEKPVDILMLLRGYFEERDAEYENYTYIFSDLMENVLDDALLERPVPKTESRWPYYCLHKIDSPPKFETHRYYYAVLVRANLAQTLHAQLTNNENLKTKLTYFIDAHMPLIHWMDKTQRFSDAKLTSPLFDPNMDFYTNILFQKWPKYQLHYVQDDIRQVPFVIRTYTRPKPVEILHSYYIENLAERVKQPVHDIVPMMDALRDLDVNTFTNAHYIRLSLQYKEMLLLCSTTVKNAWPDMDVKRIRNFKDEGPKTEKQYQDNLQHNSKVIDRVQSAFYELIERMQKENIYYKQMIFLVGHIVFCDYRKTVEELKKMDDTDVDSIMEVCFHFKSIFPSNTDIEIANRTIAGRPWKEYYYLMSCLVRVYVSEHIHKLEDWRVKPIRNALVLFRNTHLALFRYITNSPPHLKTDAHLDSSVSGRSSGITVTWLDKFYPYETPLVHPGALPDFIDGLPNVKFVTNCGMNKHKWIKLQYKKPQQVCGKRNFADMLQKACQSNETMYRYTCLEMELSFQGLYEDCVVVPSFARAVVLDEMFDNIMHPEVKTEIHDFIVDNENLVMDATSESLCYMMERCPYMCELLEEVYAEWFDWRVRTNMDMVRQCFENDGNFFRTSTLVYQRVKLSSNKKIYRPKNTNFVDFICSQIRQYDVWRYSKKIILEGGSMIKPMQRFIVERFVNYIGPGQSIDLVDLKILTMKPATLDTIATIQDIYKTASYEKKTAKTKKDRIDQLVKEQLMNLEPNQYSVVTYFFFAVQRVQSLQLVRIENTNFIRAGIEKMLERIGATSLGEISELQTTLVYSVCCSRYHNDFPLSADSAASGFDETMYSLMDGTVTCGKKENGKKKKIGYVPEKNVRAIRVNQSNPRHSITIARQQAREKLKPVCRKTEVLAIDMIAEAVEAPGNVKTTGEKRQGKQAERRRRTNIPAPKPPFVLSPCCGRIFGYKWQNWLGERYYCGVCKSNADIFQTNNTPICESCKDRVKGANGVLYYMYDDVYTNSFRPVILCLPCTKPWKELEVVLTLSLVMRGRYQPTFVASILHSVENTMDRLIKNTTK